MEDQKIVNVDKVIEIPEPTHDEKGREIEADGFITVHGLTDQK